MSYLRAEEVLPKELIETIQQYVNGKAIYIPSVEKQPWGSQTDTKKYMMERNLQIFDKYQNGFSGKCKWKQGRCMADLQMQEM